MQSRAYLDYNATAPIWPLALASVCDALQAGANASSVHESGRKARRRIERARFDLLSEFGAGPDDDLVFTSGGTEANHLALNGVRVARRLVSSVEHDSVLGNAGQHERLSVTRNGVVEPGLLRRLLEDDTSSPTLVSVMGANNETGTLQPIEALAAVCRKAGALFHVDAVQMPGKVATRFSDSGADMMTVSGHKIGGPPGVGALLLRAGLTLDPVLGGGGQERGRRAGTENAPAIAGFAAAASLIPDMLAQGPRVQALRDEMETRLGAAGAVILASDGPRLRNTSSLMMPGVPAETQVIALDLAGVAVSAGSACSSGRVRASHVLLAMGYEVPDAAAAIRVSLGWQTTSAEVDLFVDRWTQLRRRTEASATATAA